MAKAVLKNINRLINMSVSSLPVEQTFVDDLKMAIEKIHAKESRKPSKSYKPSSMKCIRNMYFQVTGTEPDPSSTSASLVGILQTGSDRHDHLQKAISEMKSLGIDCEYIDVAQYVEENKLDYLEIRGKSGNETKLYHKVLNISFMCDGIIKYRGEYFILEIKTESSSKFWERKDVAEGHHNQAITYSMSLGIDKVLFLYENRDISDKKAFIFTVTEEMKQGIITKIEECDGYVARLVPPPLPADYSAKLCQYCNYKSSCRKAGK